MDPWASSDVFAFESVSERTLEYIPMSVRMKLDLCGLKLSLAQWSGLPLAVRQIVLEVGCEADLEIQRLRRYLEFIIEAFGLGPLASIRCDRETWSARSRVPSSVVAAMDALDLARIGAATWAGLSDLQRFTLIKLTRRGHTRNLPAALEEFGLQKRRR